MSKNKRFIQDLTPDQLSMLEKGYKTGKQHIFRRKCQCILQSHSGISIKELSEYHQVSTRSIYKWLDSWESMGMSGLTIKKGRGRKPKLEINNALHTKKIKEFVENEPQSLKKVVPKIEAELHIGVSQKTLSRFLKRVITDGNASGKG